MSWYTRGGFTDENGKLHISGYHYMFPIWEVLNEPDGEHHTTPEQYTRRYDAIVSAIRKVSPETKFMGLALALPRMNRAGSNTFLTTRIISPAYRWTIFPITFTRLPRLARTLTIGNIHSLIRRTGSLPTSAI